MTYRILTLFFVFLVGGCASTPESERGPRSTIRVGSLDISPISGRLEKKAIEDLARLLIREGVEIVAVQGITRYPGVRTRLDFVDELARRAEMRHAFGEIMNNSGRQTGNAVFSVFPILSSKNQPIDEPGSSEFAAAVHALIDAGVVEINVVSVRLPGKGTVNDQSKCVKAIARANAQGVPIILAGNLPPSDAVCAAGSFQRTKSIRKDQDEEAMWYGEGEGLRPLNGRLVKTGFGAMTVVEFALYAKR